MHEKSFRGFKANRPLFKVQIKRKPGQCRPAKARCMEGSCSHTSGYTKEKSTKTFMAKLGPIKIPSPPNTLLRKIEEEKLKLQSESSAEKGSLWDSPISWDSEEILFSIANDVLDNIYKKPARKGASTKPLNSFMAFRAYNSQFGYGLKQNILSPLLASAWHSHPEQQEIWDTFAQQFNFVKPKCGFVEWVDQRYERES
ncbi:hypothetical protein HG536_0B01365 [Torulaspora globosa]|uniref:Alpha box domain-containing protein n=1 Tax=Torulaspora globosa TaxID=48254 RepID=A0A7G3ZCC2_9SACH|nr:uncharacterized protein HG536_0B00180 [Torulaspora globosa]XP_037137950.1 uncharacterized protein HG536_0B01365 [Torulaspora globosa]QLL31158.1 hypothetical protein HG536_0B00180 [Torulaspora globosa]QLL31275.1 hypothetical protein HG536_0B01365 [Torulaspora globosa]